MAPSPDPSLEDALRDALAGGRSLVHPTYRHLDRRLVLAGLTLGGWLAVVVALAAAWVLSGLLPLPSPWPLSVAVAVCGLPTAVLLVVTGEGELDLVAIVRSVVRWRRTRGLHLPGPGSERPAGYVLAAAPTDGPPPSP